ncbi:PucR family transcriptional regulator [Gordonia sp. HNM0687]|uniref:PucR family transcriptional regulator n=1 Tax=Gordonia mangrovi TaxID=2665643 RepID=A0A6L7GJI7_9ACTN|nr:PucR family transcriptional regulator [Gordonia mangrovi]MXP20064.1 PucR family transcriptional regulator [Gordonia mangrovi]UVF79325.1 PucR family transcriptional regulator ligand-binding domain-containing protein [Gordonia mangrovi]
MTTVRWLLAQRRLHLTLRGGSVGLDRHVDCVMTSELTEPGEWLSGDEVLLTTGLRLGDPTIWRDYLERLDAVGVAAVGVGVGFEFDTVPADMASIADDLGLPLFEVPLPVPFSAITRAVLDQIAAQRSSRLLAATKAQPKMTRAAASGGSTAVVRELADAVGQNVVLLDTGLAVVAGAPGPTSSADLNRLRDLVIRDPTSAAAVTVTDSATIAVSRVGSGGRTFGHLGTVGRTALDDVARMLVGHAISLLAIEHAKPRQLRRDLVELHTDTLASALDDPTERVGVQRILARAADPSGRVRALALRFGDDDAATRGQRLLVDELDGRWHAVFVHRDGPELVVLLRGDDSVELAATLFAVVNSAGPVGGGVGAVTDVRDVADAVRQARLACRTAAVGQLADLHGTRSLLTVDAVRRALADAHTQLLAPVLNHDDEHGTELRETLLAYLEANGNWGVAAAARGVHRHTLRHRVERIEDLLDVDLTDARVRAELLLMLLGAQE